MKKHKYSIISVITAIISTAVIVAMTSSCSAAKPSEDKKLSSEQAVNEISENTEAAPENVSTPSAMPFNDVKAGKWYYNAVKFCYVNGYMNGTSENTFSPSAPVTRAMFATVLYKTASASAVYDSSSFTDVEGGKWYTSAVQWAYENGYASGVGGGKFSPNAEVSREQMCVFLHTYSLKNGYDVSKSAELDSFNDENTVSQWARDAVKWAVANEIISGTSGRKLSPKIASTRAMTAQIFHKYNSIISYAEVSDEINVVPSSFDAVDALARVVTDGTVARAKTEGKYVGMFYWSWHQTPQTADIPRVAGDIVKKFPDAVNDFYHEAWENTPEGTRYFWGKPLFGFYTTEDKWVLRRHAEMLADAGVDVIFFDCTNGTYLWEESAKAIFEVFEEARKDGVNTPKIAFMLNFIKNKNNKEQLIRLYDTIYSKHLYDDLWFYWEGKPLILSYEDSMDLDEGTTISTSKAEAIKNFFTFRHNNASYFSSDKKISKKTWGWLSVYPQTKYGVRDDGTVEQICVSVAQNSTDTELVAMNAGSAVHGRSYAKGSYEYYYDRYGTNITVNSDIENSELYGINFQQQWDYALKTDPDFVFVTGWNEWIAMRFETWQGTENAFPDEFSEEYSRDIEPEDGVLKDNYYMQLCSNIRKYKGVDSFDTSPMQKSICLSTGGAGWQDVVPSYDDYIDCEEGRDANGYPGEHYTEDAVRNDIIHSKFAYDENNLYFMVQTKNELTPCDDDMWMRLFITVSDFKEDSFEGFDYVVNRETPVKGITAIERLSPDGSCEKSGECRFSLNGNTLVISVPRKTLGISEGELPTVRFKWVDNAIDFDNPDIMDVYKRGDSAPNGRFMYRVK